jgi:type IV secretion system protein VirD4
VGALTPPLSRVGYGFAIALSKLGALLSHSHQLHNARFARLDELSGLLGKSLEGGAPSLLLGLSRFGRVLRVRPTRARREIGNLLMSAPTRGGKGLLATSQLLTWPHSVIVNDIKGELYDQTAGYRQTLGDVYVIDPTGIGHRYDPLSARNTETELYSSAKHLLYNPNDKDGAVFTERATKMLTQLFQAAKLTGARPIPFVGWVVSLGLNDAAVIVNDISPLLARKLLDAEYVPDRDFEENKFRISAWDELSSRLYALLTDDIVRCFDASDFNVSDVMTYKKPTTIYLRWPERDLLALSPLVRLLWGSLIDELLATYDRAQGENCRPVLLLLDEAGRTAIPSLSEHATTVVGRGISLWVAVQSLSQLDAVYGKARAQVLRDNMETQLYYRPANQETAEYLERCLGRKSGFATSHSTHEGVETGAGLSEQGIPLLTAQEIKQLGDEEIIGFHRNLPPFRAKRMDWRRFEVLAQRRRMPASRLPVLPALARLPTLPWQRKNQLVSPYFDPDQMQ